MTDKTAIEKALTEMISLADRLYVAEKEALSHTRNEEYLKTIVSMIEDAREALAAIEAEKPAEDAFEGFYKNRFTGMIYDGTEFKKIAHEIWQYAESYHAEQCKACRKDRQPLPEAPK
jgi:electron transfer flavoprotein alpha subunit